MKKTRATLIVNEEREMKIHPLPTLGKLLFNAFFWMLLVIMESYLWIFKFTELVQWVKDLKVLWLGMGIGISVVIGLYTYCYLKHYVVRLKHINIPSISSIIAMAMTLFRICELIMVVSHFNQFASFWADGILPFILFMWIVGVSILAFVRANFIRKRRKARSANSSYAA